MSLYAQAQESLQKSSDLAKISKGRAPIRLNPHLVLVLLRSPSLVCAKLYSFRFSSLCFRDLAYRLKIPAATGDLPYSEMLSVLAKEMVAGV